MMIIKEYKINQSHCTVEMEKASNIIVEANTITLLCLNHKVLCIWLIVWGSVITENFNCIEL